jgi:hypothetical protein
VLDTAPTGHTLLLLDATGACHRETVRAYRAEHSDQITTPLMRLGNPSYSKILRRDHVNDSATHRGGAPDAVFASNG